MTLGVLVKGREHDREDNLHVVADEIAEILVVPEVKGPLGNLEVRAGHRLGELVEQGLLDLGKFCRVHHLEDVLDFVQEHDFLGTVDLGPVAKQAQDDLRKLATGMIEREGKNAPLRSGMHLSPGTGRCSRLAEGGTCSGS